MIVDVIAYSAVVALLVAPAAASLEWVLAELRLPTRLAWFAAYPAALLLPAATILWAEPRATALVLSSQTAHFSGAQWDTVLALCWGAATALMFVAYGGAWLRLTRALGRCPLVETDAGPAVVTDDVGPAVFGIVAPRVVLPRWLLHAPPAVRKTVMAHELEHIGARDQAAIVAAQLLTILLPWNLALWWFAWRLRTALEIDCDARVMHSGVDPVHYGEVLLAVGQRGASRPSIAASLTEPVTQLERRIRVMLTRPNRTSQTRAAATFVLALGIAACATQLEAPTLPSSIASAEAVSATAEAGTNDVEISAQSIEIHAPSSAAEPSTASTMDVIAMRNVLLSLGNLGKTTATSDRLVKTADGLLLEGNVRLMIENVSIATTRAVFTTTADGRAMVSMDNASVTYAE